MDWNRIPEPKGWKVIAPNGEVLLESEDPQEVLDFAHEQSLKLENDPKTVHTGVSIEGDPLALGVMQEHDHRGRLVRGPEKLRRPKGA